MLNKNSTHKSIRFWIGKAWNSSRPLFLPLRCTISPRFFLLDIIFFFDDSWALSFWGPAIRELLISFRLVPFISIEIDRSFESRLCLMKSSTANSAIAENTNPKEIKTYRPNEFKVSAGGLLVYMKWMETQTFEFIVRSY